jgi:hypothetical protein
MNRAAFVLLPFLLGSLSLEPARYGRADEPLPPPKEMTFWSPNRSVCAVSDPATQLTTVYRVESNSGNRLKLWQMYGWQRSAFVADDGRHLVIGYPGLNLLTLKHLPDQPMAYFVREGEVIGVAALSQLVRDQSKLPRTASHFMWGGCHGFDTEGYFVIETFDKRKHTFDVTTGKELQ